MTLSEKSHWRKVTISDLEAKGVDVKICDYCKGPMRLRIEYFGNIPSALLFINKIKGIYVLLHRKCKGKYTAGLRK